MSSERLSSPPVDRALRIVVAVAVVVGVILRFLPRSGLWLDEALTVNISTLPLGDIPDALRRDGHPPLHYVLLNAWTSIGGTSDWWVRALSGVLSLGALPLAFIAGRRIAQRAGAGPLGEHRTALIALALMAMLPYGVRYGSETRMYALVSLLALGGYLLAEDLLTARSAGRRRAAVAGGAALVTAGLLWSHYWSMWLLAAIGLLALWVGFRSSDAARRTGGRLLAGAMVLGGVLYLPWVPTLLYQSERTGTPWGASVGPVEMLTITLTDLSGDSLTSYLAALAVSVALLALLVARRAGAERGGDPVPFDDQHVVIGASIQRRIPVEAGLFVATLGIGWAASTATSNTYVTRYAAVVYPLFVLCIAAGVAVVRERRATVAVLSLFLLMSVYVGVSNARTDRTQAGELAEFIGADLAAAGIDGTEAAGAASIVACPDQIGVALQRALDGRRINLEIIAFPLAEDPRFIDWVDYGERNEAADVSEFFERVDDRIPDDGTVYVAAMPGYRTYEGLCEGVISHLSGRRPLQEVVERGDAGETMGLWVFGPPE